MVCTRKLNCTDGGFHIVFSCIEEVELVVKVENNEEILLCLYENIMKPKWFQ